MTNASGEMYTLTQDSYSAKQSEQPPPELQKETRDWARDQAKRMAGGTLRVAVRNVDGLMKDADLRTVAASIDYEAPELPASAHMVLTDSTVYLKATVSSLINAIGGGGGAAEVRRARSLKIPALTALLDGKWASYNLTPVMGDVNKGLAAVTKPEKSSSNPSLMREQANQFNRTVLDNATLTMGEATDAGQEIDVTLAVVPLLNALEKQDAARSGRTFTPATSKDLEPLKDDATFTVRTWVKDANGW